MAKFTPMFSADKMDPYHALVKSQGYENTYPIREAKHPSLTRGCIDPQYYYVPVIVFSSVPQTLNLATI